ncbi:AraC family transcriptional regulator [Bifidobacterium sp. ESL0764]|uniref:AraC family transcriptional regulator n=1 Tax=Bifidobacterium sp. ESL0764 TaxID=2983228 RepID=UPI0023F6D8CC|nr:AraC family transcriptional regulator [Bifidobacterium sp. ESL0764]WEV65338.1 AraC family transcriptional regulator [Bifidobacterium sp. ESL0764]
MKPAERNIDNNRSDFYIYTPSRTATSTFFYPLRIGLFRYESGYRQERSSFDSFLLMYIRDGTFTISTHEGTQIARKGDFVLLDCYRFHSYETRTGCEVLWLHFDGTMSRPYFDLIHSRLGTVFIIKNPNRALTRMSNIIDVFHSQSRISEAQMSKYITDILTELVIGTEEQKNTKQRKPHDIDDVLTFIASNLEKPLTVTQLAQNAFMSEYHFIRVFKKETGYTPHAYLLDARMHAAKYRLINSNIPLKQLCAECGFSDTSAFCALFKRKTGMSPMEFRNRSMIKK